MSCLDRFCWKTLYLNDGSGCYKPVGKGDLFDMPSSVQMMVTMVSCLNKIKWACTFQAFLTLWIDQYSCLEWIELLTLARESGWDYCFFPWQIAGFRVPLLCCWQHDKQQHLETLWSIPCLFQTKALEKSLAKCWFSKKTTPWSLL